MFKTFFIYSTGVITGVYFAQEYKAPSMKENFKYIFTSIETKLNENKKI